MTSTILRSFAVVLFLTVFAAPALAQPPPGGGGGGNPAVEDLIGEIDALKARVAALERLLQFFTLDENAVNGLTGPHLIISGVNVHIRNNTLTTDGAVDGLGNLIIGYNEPPLEVLPFERGGSHNLVVGREHRFQSFGGLVAGFHNTVSGAQASVTAGRFNVASGGFASVSGGAYNLANANSASASGGFNNTASNLAASVSGGENNTASGRASSVSGGGSDVPANGNVASGDYASVSGGVANTAAGANASVSGDAGLLSAITEEATTRSAADAQLQNALDTEATARLAGDATLQAGLTVADNRITVLDASLLDVNGSLTALQSGIATETAARQVADNNLQGQINNLDVSALEARVTTIEGDVGDIRSNTVLELSGVLSRQTINGYDTALFSGLNVQIVNGLGVTNTRNGLGNLIVGYDGPRSIGDSVCSDGQFLTEDECLGAGRIWAQDHKSGSHYFVGGDGNSYSQSGGAVFGQYNVSNALYATATGGTENTAAGVHSSVSGGFRNTASGRLSSVSGGLRNIASGTEASVSGGVVNEASGDKASVTGGALNLASGNQATVTGGAENIASGLDASVSGGRQNEAAGNRSSILGGFGLVTYSSDDTIPALP